MMKKITLFIFLTLFAFQFGNAQVNKNFDASAPWSGFMSWTGSGDVSQGWAVAELVVLVDAVANTANFKPSRVNNTDSYWFADPTDLFGLNTMTATLKVDDDTLIATDFNWIGNISSFDLDSGYSAQAFIKVFNGDYSAILYETYQDITTTGDFTLNYDGSTAGAAHVQYGLIMVGLNVNPGAAYDAQYDALGSVEVTAQVLSLKDNEISTFSSYPNPTKDSWTIKSKNIEMTSINVFDILGKNVLTMSPNSAEATINARNLKSGLYFAKVETANGSSSVKLIKE